MVVVSSVVTGIVLVSSTGKGEEVGSVKVVTVEVDAGSVVIGMVVAEVLVDVLEEVVVEEKVAEGIAVVVSEVEVGDGVASGTSTVALLERNTPLLGKGSKVESTNSSL